MFKLLPSNKPAIFAVPAPPEFVIEQFRKRMCEEDLIWIAMDAMRLPRNDTYVGRIEGRKIEVRFVTSVFHNAESTLTVQVENDGDGSIITAQYSRSFVPTALLATLIVLVVFSFGAVAFSPVFMAHANIWWGVLVFMLFAFTMIGLFNLGTNKQLQKLLSAVVRSCEGVEPNARQSSDIQS